MESIKFSENITINDTQQIIFDYTQDYSNRLTWDSFLKRAELMAGASKADKGVKAYCVSKDGWSMVTEYVSFQRPIVTAIKMTKGPIFFKSFVGSWRFKYLSEKETEVTFLYSFQLRFPFTLFNYLVKRNFQSNVKKRLTDLKCCLEKVRA